MKLVIQRVLNAKVEIDNKVYNEILNGLLIYIGFEDGDNKELVDKIVLKVLNLRIFEDENKKTNLNIFNFKNSSILLISQFTLLADTKKGNRPSFVKALNQNDANLLYEYALSKFNEFIKTKPGVFGADMKVSSTNDGPFTIYINTEEYNDN